MRADADRKTARGATLIRHFFHLLPLPIGTLALGLIQLGGKALPVDMVGTAVLLKTRLPAAILTAIKIATVTRSADIENHTTPRPFAFSLAKLDCRGAHAQPKAGLDNGRRSWQARRCKKEGGSLDRFHPYWASTAGYGWGLLSSRLWLKG
jgi:hypothetical protein